MNRILVPLDGSEFAERALEPALNLAARHGSEVHLASIVADLPPVPLASGDEGLVSEWFQEEENRARTYLDGMKERMESSTPDRAIHTHVIVGPVTRSLQSLAEELEADLIMLTTHGRGAWQRAWLGSVADQLLRRASTPLLLLRDETGGRQLFKEAGSPAHVLVPLDGSKAAETVLDVLGSTLPAEGGHVSLVSVIHQPFPLATTYLPHTVSDEAMMKERKERLETYLQEVEGRFRAAGAGSVESRVLAGDDAAQSLLQFAKEENVDLIALSTRGRGGVSRFFLGSVADKLVRGSPVPLLTARRPPEPDEEE